MAFQPSAYGSRLLLQEKVETVQAVVATILSRLCGNPLHGPRVILLLGRLLPPGLVTAIQVLHMLRIWWIVSPFELEGPNLISHFRSSSRK